MLACSPIDSISRELTRTDYFIARWRSTGKACAWFCNQQPAKWIRVSSTHIAIPDPDLRIRSNRRALSSAGDP